MNHQELPSKIIVQMDLELTHPSEETVSQSCGTDYGLNVSAALSTDPFEIFQLGSNTLNKCPTYSKRGLVPKDYQLCVSV